MNNDVSTTKQLLVFLNSYNFCFLLGAICFIIFILVFKKSIAELIQRLKNFIYKKGNSELKFETENVNGQNQQTMLQKEATAQPEKNNENTDTINQEKNYENGNIIAVIYPLLIDGKIEDAKQAFQKYTLEEKDIHKLESNKSFYLFLLFKLGKENDALDDLKEFSKVATSEKTRYDALYWLAEAYFICSQTQLVIELWKDSLKTFKSQIIVTDITIDLSSALNRDDKSLEAKKLLISRLNSDISNDEKSKIFNTLSETEKALNNKQLAAYCKDKSSEYNSHDKTLLFDSAYMASNEGELDISVSNYFTLLNLNPKHNTALNNMGVIARDKQLPIKSCEFYGKSSELGESLASVNLGFMLLNSGFIKEAENIAQKVLKEGHPHPNVYNLMSSIKDSIDSQEKKWKNIIEISQKRQKYLRKYTDSYYLNSIHNFTGKWIIDLKTSIEIEITENKLSAKWQENITNIEYQSSIFGEINNSSFKGKFIRKKQDNSFPFLLGDDSKNVNCLGFLADNGNTFLLYSEKENDDFYVELKREKKSV